MKYRQFSAVLALILGAAAAPGYGQVQTDSPSQQVQELERRRKAQAEIDTAAEAARQRQALGAAGEVTYEQVMAKPDDIDLNYQFALTQIAKGNLRSAAATLERITMVNKDLPKVRLLYGVVLFRLDNLDDAERELQALKKEKMPDSLRAELDDYIGKIHAKRRKAHVTAILGAGLDFDDNRNAAPATGQRLFFDLPITLNEASTRKTDTTRTMTASLSGTYDLGYQAGHQLFANLSYYRAEQVQIRTLNLQNYGAELGTELHLGAWTASLSYQYAHLRLHQETYMRSNGGKLRFERPLFPGWSGFIESAYSRPMFNRTEVVPTGDQRTGDKVDTELGMSFPINPKMRGGLTLGHVHTGAAKQFNAFDRFALGLNHSWLLGKGMFYVTAFTYNRDEYRQAERAVSRTSRRDESIRARGTFGLPLNALYKPLLGLVWTFTYEYYQAFSNLTNYGYTNNKVSSMLTYKYSH